MTTIKEKNGRDWTSIGCVGTVIVFAAYGFVSTRVASITEEYRREYLVQHMNINDMLMKTECEVPVAEYISALKRDGITSDGKDQLDMVNNTTRERCFLAQATISINRDKMKNAKYLKPSSLYLVERLFK